MKTLPLLAVSLVAAAAYAMDAITVTPKFEADQKSKYKSSMKMNVGGQEVELSGTIVVTVKKVDGDAIKLEYNWENPKAVVGGEEQNIPFAPTDVVVNKAGELKEVGGGIQGSDPVRTLVVIFAHLPQAPVEKDGKWSATYPKSDKIDLGERKVDGTYVGEEEVNGKKAHKFNTTMKEGEFSVKMSYWTTLEGKLVKIESEFAEMPIPIAGANASGTFKGDLVD